MDASTYLTDVLLNVAVDEGGRCSGFDGYRPGHELAEACTADGREVVFTVRADSPERAADMAFTLGNGQPLTGSGAAVDETGAAWPADVRSVSVGDVVRVLGPDGTSYLAVERSGFRAVTAPDALVPLAGSVATSRPAH
jgi:hypothetical protein